MVEARTDERITLGCFDVGGHLYAVDVGHVREVVRWQAPTPLPRSPALIDGVVDVRDLVIPVVDLGAVLLDRRVEGTQDARIAIVELDGLVLGLVVDAAVDVLEIESSGLDAPPALTARAGCEAVRALVRREGGDPILVLSLEHILERIYRSGTATSEVA